MRVREGGTGAWWRGAGKDGRKSAELSQSIKKLTCSSQLSLSFSAKGQKQQQQQQKEQKERELHLAEQFANQNVY